MIDAKDALRKIDEANRKFLEASDLIVEILKNNAKDKKLINDLRKYGDVWQIKEYLMRIFFIIDEDRDAIEKIYEAIVCKDEDNVNIINKKFLTDKIIKNIISLFKELKN